MITWFNAPNEGLSPGGQLTLKTLTATENKTYSEEGTAYTSVTVNVEGGGGSSDFSTAEVTVNGMGIFVAEVASLIEGKLSGTCFKSPLETSFTVVLYHGETIMQGVTDVTPDFIIPEGETNIVQDGSQYIIKGDCTITIS